MSEQSYFPPHQIVSMYWLSVKTKSDENMNHNFCKPLKICLQVKSRKKTPKFSRFDAAASFSVMNVWLLCAEKTVNQSGVECDRHFESNAGGLLTKCLLWVVLCSHHLVLNDLGHRGQNLPLLFHSNSKCFLRVYQRINNRNWVATKVLALVFECYVLVSRKLNFLNKWSGLCTGSPFFWAVNRLLHFPAAAVLPKHLVLVSPSAAPQPLPNILCGETCPPMVAHHPIFAPIHHKAPRNILGYKI